MENQPTQDQQPREQEAVKEPVQTTASTTATTDEQKEQKKQNTKNDKEKKKQERLAKRQQKTTEEEYKKDPNDISAHLFGELELNRSQSDPEKRYERKFTAVKDLDESLNG